MHNSESIYIRIIGAANSPPRTNNIKIRGWCFILKFIWHAGWVVSLALPTPLCGIIVSGQTITLILINLSRYVNWFKLKASHLAATLPCMQWYLTRSNWRRVYCSATRVIIYFCTSSGIHINLLWLIRMAQTFAAIQQAFGLPLETRD